MYIPEHYTAPNRQACVDFIMANPFGLLASNGTEIPSLTHLPFVINDSGTEIISHMAKANPHLHGVASQKCTAVFSGPHAYIGTHHYDKSQNVPTWNYISIHAHGRLTVVKDVEENIALMEIFINHIDPSFDAQWQNLNEKYKIAMLNAITPFKIKIENLEGKFKLSQNKTETEQRRIITHLDSEEPKLANYMRTVLFPN